MSKIVILGIFVADTAYRAERPPRMGETLIGRSFHLSPGGKGSNQAVAAAKAGGDVAFLSRLGTDPFAEMATGIWTDAEVEDLTIRDPDSYTGAAYIFIDDTSGDNAIIVCPGAAMDITTDDVKNWGDTIRASSIFITQLEQPIDAAIRALEIARGAGVTTLLNPAPAAPLPEGIWGLCDYVTPNETEASDLTGLPVSTIDEARVAADALLTKGARGALITLGEMGALLHTADVSEHIPAITVGPVVETTGAGDAFNGAFVAALSNGASPLEAARFGCAAAGISVTRRGTASSMPTRDEVERLLANQ